MHPFDIDFKILNLNFDSMWIVRVLPVALRDLKHCQTDLTGARKLHVCLQPDAMRVSGLRALHLLIPLNATIAVAELTSVNY